MHVFGLLGKPQDPERTHTDMGENMQTPHRRDSNLGPSCCEAIVLTTALLCCPLLSRRKWIDGWNLCLQTDMLGRFLFISNTLQSLAGACLQIINKTHSIIIFFKSIRSLLAPVSFWYYTGHCNPFRLLVSRWSYECDHWDALTVITIKHAVYLLNRTSYFCFSVLFMVIIKNAPADTLAEIHWLLYSH